MFTYHKTTNKIEVDPNVVVAVPELRLIWDRDSTEDKIEAMAFLGFIYFVGNPKSPFRNYEASERTEKVIEQTFPEHLQKWKSFDDKPVLQAYDKYVKWLDLAPERALLDAAEGAIYELTNKLNSPKTKNKEGLLSKIKTATADIKYLRELVKEEEDKRKETKGGRVILKREDPNYKPMFVPKLAKRPPFEILNECTT